MTPDTDIPLCSALAAHRAGHEVVLIAPGSKRPVHEDGPNRDVTEAEIGFYVGKRCFNYGLRLRRLIVFDSDGPEADDWLAEHGIRSGFEVLTSKGRHVYTRAPDGIEVRTRIRLRACLDVLTGHDHVTVGPGSWIEKTETRYVIPGGRRLLGPDQLPVCPLEVAELLTPVRETRAAIRLACEMPEERAMRYIDRIEESRQGNAGSKACFVAALKCLSLARGDLEQAWKFLVYFNRTRCFPPFDEEAEGGPDSLKKKLRDAAATWKPK